MTAAKKITVTLPRDALVRAQKITGKGLTGTLTDALLALDREHRVSTLRSLRGKVPFELDLEKTRK